MTKVCNGCQEEKPLDGFRRGRGYKDGIRARCKACEADALAEWRRRNPDKRRLQDARHNDARKRDGRGYYDPARAEVNAMQRRESHLKRKYGITLGDYLAMHDAQGGLCATCRGVPDGDKDLVVDHCHATGAVRGLLCDSCNVALGRVRESLDTLRNMVVYLTDR